MKRREDKIKEKREKREERREREVIKLFHGGRRFDPLGKAY